MRIPTDKHIKFKCSACKIALEAKNGNIIKGSRKGDYNKDKNETVIYPGRKRRIIIISTIVAVLTLLLLYTWLTVEKRSYNSIKKKPYLSKIEEHLDKYENGTYTVPLVLMRDSFYFHNAMAAYNSDLDKTWYDCIGLEAASAKMESYKIQELKDEYEKCIYYRSWIDWWKFST